MNTDFGLSCLSPDDYGATALQMQSLANAIDAQLTSQAAEFNQFLTAPTALATTTTIQTGIPTFGATVGAAGAGDYALTFANYTPVDFPPFGAIFANGFLNFPTDRSGWYHVGAYVPMTASGAITALSYRLLELNVGSNTLVPNTTKTFATFHFDTSTGGEHLMTQGVVEVSGEGTFSLWARASHANVASTMNVPVGATIWLHYLGPSDLVRVT